jgi:ferrous iron transport protein A
MNTEATKGLMRGGECMETTLGNVKSGKKVIVKRIDIKGEMKRRLMDMGITAGEEILVRKVAPLGDPVEINVRGYELTLRKSEAEKIIVV